MYRLLCKKGTVPKFLNDVQDILNLRSNELSQKVNISDRTLRYWKKEKYLPDREKIVLLSQISGISMPKHRLIRKYWNNKEAATVGGKKRFEKHGPLGDNISRLKGGKNSWTKRKNNPILLKKYFKSSIRPNESANLAEFIGIMLGDGMLIKSQCAVFLNSKTERNYIFYIKGLMEKLFGARVTIYKKQFNNLVKIAISRVNVVEYLISKGLSIGNKAHLQIDVPGWICNNDLYMKACLRGLIDTDGYFISNKYSVNENEYQSIKMIFTNKSVSILHFVMNSLRKFGFSPKWNAKFSIGLYNQNEVKRYLKVIGTHNSKPIISKILEESHSTVHCEGLLNP